MNLPITLKLRNPSKCGLPLNVKTSTSNAIRPKRRGCFQNIPESRRDPSVSRRFRTIVQLIAACRALCRWIQSGWRMKCSTVRQARPRMRNNFRFTEMKTQEVSKSQWQHLYLITQVKFHFFAQSLYSVLLLLYSYFTFRCENV